MKTRVTMEWNGNSLKRLFSNENKQPTCGWFQIMARSGINSWHPLESNGKPLVFLTQEEADAYKDWWLMKKGNDWKAFSYAIEC